MKRAIFAAIIAAAMAAACAVSTAVLASASVRKASPDITCDSGYVVISNFYVNGGITAEGQGNPLIYGNPAGSCWKAILPYTDPLGTTGYQYENEAGRCMWDYQSSTGIKLGDCVEGDSLEQFYGVNYVAGVGWRVEFQDDSGTYWELNVPSVGCSLGDAIFHATLLNNNQCIEWMF
jgi:hypothetical protein